MKNSKSWKRKQNAKSVAHNDAKTGSPTSNAKTNSLISTTTITIFNTHDTLMSYNRSGNSLITALDSAALSQAWG